MSKMQEERRLLASELNTKPLSLRGKKLHDKAVQEALAWASQWMKKSSTTIKKALNAASRKVENIGKNVSYDANAQILLRAYGKFRQNGTLKKQDIADIATTVEKEFRVAAEADRLQELREQWHAKLPVFACDVSRAVAKSKARSEEPQKTMMVVRHRHANRKLERGSVSANDPRVTQQNAFNELAKLGFGKELNTQLTKLEHTITDPKHRELARGLLIFQAHAGYINLKHIYMDGNNKQQKVPIEEMSKKTKVLADTIPTQYKDDEDLGSFNLLTGKWSDERNQLAADFKADV